jgi:hypothetical protein
MPRCRREAGRPEVCKRLGRNWVVRSRGGPDAGFANPEVYEFLEAERFKYAIRLRQTERIGYLLKRPVGFHSYCSFTQMFQRPLGEGVRPGDACHRLIRLWAQGLLPDT